MVLTDTQKRCAIWLRVSTEEQAQGESPATHEKRARMYAEVKGWEVVTVYDLCGVSGKTVLHHPEAQRMVADVAAGRIEALIFSRLARLARNVKELLEISELFKRHSAALVSLGESIDTSTPAGNLMYTMLGALAEWERNEISARVSASVPIRAAQGRPTGGVGPWGYVWRDDGDGKRLVIDQGAADKVRLVFGVLIEEKGNKLRAARRLNGMGIKTRHGSDWTASGIQKLTSNAVYIGEKKANYQKREGTSWVAKPESEWVTHPVEPVIGADTWEAVQLLLEKRKNTYAHWSNKLAPPRESTQLYGGLLVCSCGAVQKMYKGHTSKTRGKRYACRVCRRAVWESDVTTALLQALQEIIKNPHEIEQARESRRDEYLAAGEKSVSLQREAEKVKKKRDRLLDLYSDGGGSKTTILAQLREMDAMILALENEAVEAAHAASQYEAEAMSRGPLMEQAENLANMWGDLTEDEQRVVLRELIEKITIGANETTVTLYAVIPNLSKEGWTVSGQA